ncbi:phage terminase large subunit [Bythopirellula goksoeyrii]|uniref:Terminase-like family protein n=1 Tax=Bythopirellula goksoeyrii TaxID=1400387 RepID=A0A5B9QV77_9BACT|nr:phage terminase large subunit [Bythopirellula goksoeyrii]QEG37833.1 Terminase-like family protein [Bythopirellula goksoeyrii]
MSSRTQSLVDQMLRTDSTPQQTLASRLRQGVNRQWRTAARAQERNQSLDLLAWGRRYLARHFVHPPSKMHRWLAAELDLLPQQRGTKLNVIGPRGGAKSTIASLAYVLRVALEGWEPYVWILSDTSSQAQMHLANLKRELVENQRITQEYEHVHFERDVTECLLLNNGTLVEAFGSGQRLRGRRHGAHRPSLIVCDDLQNDEHMQSAYQRDTSSRWFHGTVLKAGDKRTNILNLATALHRDALAMQLDRTPGWISRKFRAIERWPTDMDLWAEWERIYTDVSRRDAGQAAWNFFQKNRQAMQAGADLLWPEREDLYLLMKMRTQEGHATFEREKQSSPLDPARCEWPAEYFDDSIWFQAWPADLQFKTIALDPSKGRDSKHGDYSALVVLGIDRRGMLYVEADLARRPTPEIVASGVALCWHHQADAFGVEANQFQELLADEFVREFARQGIHWCTPAAIHNHVNKQVRIRRLGPYLAQRRVRFLAASPGTQLLVDQLRDFPLGSHDDGPDALEMALRLAEEHYGSGNRNDGLGSRLIGGEP